MAAFETTPEAVDGGTQQGTATIERSPFDMEETQRLEALDQQLSTGDDISPSAESLQRWYDLEYPGETMPNPDEVHTMWKEKLDAQEDSGFERDAQMIEKKAEERGEMLKERLEAYQAENPGVDISEVSPEEVLEPEEIAVMKKEAEEAEKSGINWWNVLKGVLIIGGIAAAAYFFLPSLGYSFKAGEIIDKALAIGSEAVKYIHSGLEALGEGMVSVFESVKSWKVWTEIGNLFGSNSLDNVEKIIKGGDMGKDFLPLPNPLPFDPGIGKIPPIG